MNNFARPFARTEGARRGAANPGEKREKNFCSVYAA
jgi:hypothetical protein